MNDPVEGRGRVEGDAGTSFGSFVTRSKKEGGIWDSGIARAVFGPSKKCPARASSDAGGGKREPALVLALESRQYKEGCEEGQGEAAGW